MEVHDFKANLVTAINSHCHYIIKPLSYAIATSLRSINEPTLALENSNQKGYGQGPN